MPNIKKHQPKKEYSLRLKQNVKTTTVSEISHSREKVYQTMNGERLLSEQNKNPSVFPKPNDPNLTANGGCMIIRLIISMVEKDMIILIVNKVDMDMTIRLIINMVEMDMVKLVANMVDVDMIMKLIINTVEMNVIIGLMINMMDVGVIKQIMKDMGSIYASVSIKSTILMVMIATYIATYIVTSWGNHQNNTDTQ